ncbi:hypothetical protein DL770_011761 [Monosporascus sp. CRB-9-2]|nr:hypothetical protein DL770_011761 [Monosporascus sp. CRB-9-2]
MDSEDGVKGTPWRMDMLVTLAPRLGRGTPPSRFSVIAATPSPASPAAPSPAGLSVYPIDDDTDASAALARTELDQGPLRQGRLG